MRTGKVGKATAKAGAKFGGKEKACKCCSVYAMVGERSIRGEVRAEALVDFIRVRMPE